VRHRRRMADVDPPEPGAWSARQIGARPQWRRVRARIEDEQLIRPWRGAYCTPDAPLVTRLTALELSVGVPLVARCQSRRFRLWRRTVHEAPESTCTCGIYAVLPHHIPKRGCSLPPGCTPIIGQVSLWGDVIECERGWRAAFAYPARLYVPGVSVLAQEIAADLADYGIPVDLLDVESMAAAVDAVAGKAA